MTHQITSYARASARVLMCDIPDGKSSSFIQAACPKCGQAIEANVERLWPLRWSEGWFVELTNGYTGNLRLAVAVQQRLEYVRGEITRVSYRHIGR